jgi:hypothetical protein
MAKDLLLNTDEDIHIDYATGDLALGYSDQQHQKDVLFAHVGEYKESPFIGVGIEDYLLAPFDGKVRQELERQIKLNLEADGGKNVTVKAVSIESIFINANYLPNE